MRKGIKKRRHKVPQYLREASGGRKQEIGKSKPQARKQALDIRKQQKRHIIRIFHHRRSAPSCRAAAFAMMGAVIKAGRSMSDISFMGEDYFRWNYEAKKAGITLMEDVGVSPLYFFLRSDRVSAFCHVEGGRMLTDLEKRIVILSLVSKTGKNPDIWGYARLRKSILLLQKEEGVPLGFSFGLERERPVSPELQLFLEMMMFNGDITVENTPTGFRRVIGELGLALLRENPGIISQYEEQTNRVFEMIRSMSLTDLRVAARNTYLAHPE